MGLDINSRARFNLDRAQVLLMDNTQMGMSILVQIVTGLGAKDLYRCATVAEAKDEVKHHALDLVVVDAGNSSEDGYEFVRWLRTEGPEPNRYAPVLVTAGHTPVASVSRARDCGAQFIIKRPLSPLAVLERIVWVSREGRGFVVSDTYVGPDRRFNPLELRENGRRREDRQAALAAAQTAATETANGSPAGDELDQVLAKIPVIK